MAILLDPLFGDEARGQIAKCVIFKRSQVHPQFGGSFYHQVNWTPDKITQAQSWKTLCDAWRALPQATINLWKDQAPGVLTGFNFFMQLKGIGPPWVPYVPPAGNNILFNFIDLPYTPPAGNQINFNF